MRILYHDDFDGAASAALLTRFLIDHDVYPTLQYASVDYTGSLVWAEEAPAQAQGDEFALVDFQYHPRARFWFDHHPTAWKHAEWKQQYQRRRVTEKLMDWTPATSCAEVIWTHLDFDWDYLKTHESLRRAANMIDGAQYPTVEDYFKPTRPEIKLSHAWHRLTDQEKVAVIGQLAAGRLVDAPDLVEAKVQEAVAVNLAGLDQSAEFMERRGNTVLVDAVKAKTGFIRFAPYYYFPDALYALTIYQSDNDVRIGLGKNPWISFTPHDLGKLAREGASGGGHPFAAGGIFRASDSPSPYNQAWAFMAGAAVALNAAHRGAAA